MSSVPTTGLEQNPQDDQNAQANTAQVPTESPNGPPQKYGQNNEQLPDHLKAALRSLIEQFRIEGLVARRHEILKTRRARYYFMGQQYLWFDWDVFDWKLPTQGGFSADDDKDMQEQPRYNYTLNVYQPFGLAFIAVFASQIPTVRFFPQSVNRSNDVTAAKAASEAAALIEENNQMQQKLISVGRLLWTDGKIGAFVRYVCDSERFGESDNDDMGTAYTKMGEDTFVCPDCREETPVSMFAQGQEGQPATMQQQPACFGCGTPLDESNFKAAPRVAVPQSNGTTKIPNGQEMIDFYGSLELATPPWCSEFFEFPWLQLQFEVHKGKLKSIYPHVADQIQANVPMTAEDVYARATRLAVAQGLPVLHPGDVMYNLVTYLRTWLRPWAFDALDNKELAQELKQLFPDGCYCAFAGDTYCESRNEKMSDHWRVMHALPGDGQSRPALGESSIDIQDQINTLGNIAIEAFEYGIPPVYADPEVLDFEQMSQRTIEPGVHVPARPRAGQQLATAFFQPEPAQVPQQLFTYMQELMGPVYQLVTGITAAVFGGTMDDVKTAKAYQQARDMSLGRMSVSWNRFKAFYSEIMELGVKCFRANRPGDVERVLPGTNSEFESKEIRLADLDGNTNARPEADETYPMLRSQKEAKLMQVIQMAADDPVVGEILSEPANLGIIKGILGLEDFDVPGDDARTHQLREIEAMLGNPGVPDPMDPTGQPQATIEPGLFENHEAHLAECKRWFDSDDGQEAKNSNPQGYATVEAHAQMHQQMMAAMAMAAAPPPMPQKPGGGPPQEPPEQPEAPQV